MIPRSIVATIVILYVILLVSYPRFGIVDDHQFATTARMGESPHFPLNVSTENGHFEPLDGQEYTVLGKLFDFTPRMCYSFNAAQLVLLVLICVVFLKDFVPTGWAYTAIALMLASPGFVAAWFRLNVGERGALFWSFASLCSVQLLRRSGHWRWLFFAAIAGNLALYYKEPVFAGLAAFSGLELISALASRKWTRKNLAHAILLASTAVFLAVYYVLIARHQTGNYAEQRRFVSTVQNQIFNFRSYMLETHPLIFFILVPDAIAAGLRAIRTRFGQTSTLDSLSIAGLSYVVIIAILNLPTTLYYLLPAYAFSLAPIAKRLSSISWRAISGRIWVLGILLVIVLCAFPLTWIAPLFEKHTIIGLVAVTCLAFNIIIIASFNKNATRMFWSISASLALICVLGNQIPATVNQLADAKYGPWSFQRSLVELRAAVQSSNQRPVPIFLLDSPRAFCVEGYQSIGEYLRLDFAVGRDFDMFSEVPAEPKFVPDPGSPYSVFRDASATQINPGALLVGLGVSQAQLHQWCKSGRLLYVISWPYWLHMVSLDSAIQRIKSAIKPRLGKSESLKDRSIAYCLLIAE